MWYHLSTLKDLKKECDFKNGTTFEVLEKNMVRMYLDVEKIPREREDMIEKIIHDWCALCGIPEKYALTENLGSHHPGLSYHVYFPFKTWKFNIVCGIRQLKVAHPEYRNFIDEGVYDRNRLFRLPYQIGITPAENGYVPTNDCHKIKKGTFEDCVIQNISKLPDFKKRFENVSPEVAKANGLTPTKISGPKNAETQQVGKSAVDPNSDDPLITQVVETILTRPRKTKKVAEQYKSAAPSTKFVKRTDYRTSYGQSTGQTTSRPVDLSNASSTGITKTSSSPSSSSERSCASPDSKKVKPSSLSCVHDVFGIIRDVLLFLLLAYMIYTTIMKQ